MADYFHSGPSGSGIQASAQALSDLTPAELMALPTKVRPDWMVTRYPVSLEEFERLNERAHEPDPAGMALGAEAGQAQQDQATDNVPRSQAAGRSARERAGAVEDVPEDGGARGPNPLAPSGRASFIGIPATGWQPSDTSIAVGQSNILLGVNTDLAGFSKTGTQQFRWNNMTALFKNVLPAGASIFDPALFYDHYEHRYVVVVAARRQNPAGSWLLVAASQTENPGGTYWLWALDVSLDGSTHTNNWGDYPKVGFDTQGVYLSMNMFAIGGGGGFQYAKIRILNKRELYTGSALHWYDFWNLKDPDNSLSFTVQPAAHFRGTGGNPPAYFVNGKFPSGNSLTLWVLANPLASWSGGAPTLTRRDVACRAYDFPPNAQQLGSPNLVATNDPRLLNAVFQFVGNTQHLWTCHTVKVTWAGEAQARSAVQWYEIDVNGGVVQQGAFGASGNYYFFPAIQTDVNRNAFLVFCRSGSSEYVSIRQTGRGVNDPANSLQGSALVKAGESAYTGNRWGDYTGICRDGADATVVWGYAQYAAASGAWGTWAASFKF